MGKNSPSFVLKTVFKDISNIENIIKDSKKIEQSYDKVNFKDDKDVEKLVEDTKTIVNSLKAEVTKIDAYFHDNYKTWKNETVPVANGIESSYDADNAVHEEALEKDSLTKIVNEVNTEKIEKESESITDKAKKMKNKKKSKSSEQDKTDKKKIEEAQAATENDTKKEANSKNKTKNTTKPDPLLSKDDIEITDSERDLNKESSVAENVIETIPEADVAAFPEADAVEAIPEADAVEAIPEADAVEAIPEAGALEAIPEADAVETTLEAAAVEKTIETETTIEKDNIDTPTETKIAVNNVDVAEQKVFLKCVDIKKLIKPDVLPRLKTPSSRKSRDSLNDSVLIISDSEEDTGNVNKKHKSGRPKRAQLDSKLDKNSKNKEHLGQNSTNVGKRQTRNKKSLKDDSCITIVSDSDSKESSCIEKRKEKEKNKKIEVESSSDSDSKSSVTKKSKHDKNGMQGRRGKPKKDLKKTLSDTSSLSESEITSKTQKSNQNNSEKSKKKSMKKHSKTEKIILDPKTDKKFSSEAYVSLPRIPCENLKDYYSQQNEIVEVQRLTNINNLKRSRTNRTTEKKDHRSSSDTENVKPKSKRKRAASKNSHSSDGNLSDEESIAPNLKETEPEVTQMDSKQESENNEMDQQTVKMILDDNINSGSDTSAHESEADEKKKAKKDDGDKKSKKAAKDKESEKKDEKSDASMSDEEKKKQKSKWRKDKLLTAKVSDSDSEDEFIKFKKRSEKVKQDAKTRVCRKKLKNVIDSDSDSENENKKKDSSGDEFKPQRKSSSSESDSDKEQSENDKEDEKDPEKKKRRRIKRVKDSSSEDENKSTRKTIRRVIGHESLAEATKRAEKDEKERKARIAERQKKYNEMFDSDKPEDATVDKVVLDFDEETKEEILAVHKDLAKKLKPHQVKGVHYMWDACYESVKRAKKTNGSGCILAHCMGLGKTLQVITLVHTLLTNELTEVRKVLVVCPVNTVLNWVAEFSKWLDDIDGSEIDVYDLVSSKQNYERKYQVQEWTKDGGVLVIGYDMFRNITNPTNKRLKKSERDIFHKGLVNPGPDLVVCDEGHLLKNEKTNLSIAMNRIHTVRRIVLTGTPMQNNLKEYYCMVQFVKPNLLGTYKEYLNRFVNPITNGQYTDSTQHDINIMRKRSHVLHKMLDGVVQRKDYAVLTPYLPPKYEYVMFLTLTEIQIKLYRHYLEERSRRPVDTKMRTTFLFMDFQEFQRICTHPRVLLLKSQENAKKAIFDDDEDSEGSLKDFIDDNESEAESSGSGGSNSDSSASDQSVKSKDKKKDKGRPAQRLTRNSAATLGIDIEEETKEAEMSNEWWSPFCSGDELENIALSSKLYLFFEILQQCELIGDKLLVFSQSLYSLNIIEYFLAKIDEATQKGESVNGFSGSWAIGLDYFRLDGSSSCDNRSAWCKSFNSPDNPRARLFLISTRAGGLGINLTGANRVIIFDVSWNPSHDVQSIYRVYRFGQTKPCYIYRFVTNGTMEMKIYERQVTKQAISKRVIDEQQIDRHYNQTDLAELYNFDPKPDNQPTPLIPKDVLLAELLQKEKDRVFTYHEHQSLLENKEDEELNEAERKAAWEEFENEKTARVAANTAGGWIKNLPITSITAALVNIVQKDNPTWTREQVQSVVPLIVEQLREQVDKGEMTLFTRIVSELKLMQASQQQRLQEYYMQQQLRMLQQRYAQQQQNVHQQRNAGPSTGFDFGNALEAALRNQSAPTISNEIVELND